MLSVASIGVIVFVVQHKLRKYLGSPEARADPTPTRSTAAPLLKYVDANPEGSQKRLSSWYWPPPMIFTKKPAFSKRLVEAGRDCPSAAITCQWGSTYATANGCVMRRVPLLNGVTT